MKELLDTKFLPTYEVLFANIWCEIEGIEVPFKLYEAGLSKLKLVGESEELVYFSKNISAKVIFKKQEFQMKLNHKNTCENGKYYNYEFDTYFDEVSTFKKWLLFVKSIYSLYLKRSLK